MRELLIQAKSGETQHAIQSEQQAETARYLNELNAVSRTGYKLVQAVKIALSGWNLLSVPKRLEFKWSNQASRGYSKS
jgi:hypothetical protein